MASELRDTIYGRVAVDFVEDRLANLCEENAGVQTGPFGSQLHQEDYVAVGTPIITVEHLAENRILHEGVPRVSDSDRDRLSKYSLRTGDIVFSRVGSVDRRALVRPAENGWLFSGRCLRVRPKPDTIDSRFLSYFFGLPAFKEHIRAIAVGATMPSLNTSILSDVLVPHPPQVSEQRAIADILDALDDKIDLNRRINETLEATTQAIFKDWFVDFGPTWAKTEGRAPYLATDLWTLFPDSFDKDGKPTGWRVDEIRSMASTINYGFTQSAKPIGPGPRFLRITDIQGGLVNWSSVPFCEATDADEEKYQLISGDIVVARTGASTGENLYIVEPPKAVFASYLVRFRFHSAAIARVVAQFMRSTEYRSFVAGAIGGSAQPNASAQVLGSASMLFPSPDSADAFLGLVAPMDALKRKNELQNETLCQLRDELLPKLISGEIRVMDAAKTVEAAL